MKQQDIDVLATMKAPTNFVLVNVDKAELREGIVGGTYFLVVQGTKPWISMRVDFSPLIYIGQPEYWGIQVIGIQSGIGLPTTAPYSHYDEVSQFMGKKGVEVIGANQTIKLDK